MVINAYGVLSDHLNRVFLQKDAENETLAPLGRVLVPGQLPPHSLAATFREETGLIVLPVRLTGLYFRRGEPDALFFCFRCLLRGGKLVIPAGQPEAGFFESRPLPQPMQSIHQQQVSQALYHTGGRPHWEQQVLSLRMRVRSWLGRKTSEPAAAIWRAKVTVITHNANGQVLWVKRPQENIWQLPTAECRPNEAPWATARRALRDTLRAELPLADLPAVYIGKNKRKITFVFTAESGVDKTFSILETAYFNPGAEPDNCQPQHVAQAAEALNSREETRFVFQSEH